MQSIGIALSELHRMQALQMLLITFLIAIQLVLAVCVAWRCPSHCVSLDGKGTARTDSAGGVAGSVSRGSVSALRFYLPERQGYIRQDSARAAFCSRAP
jgi:hypothetical protein